MKQRSDKLMVIATLLCLLFLSILGALNYSKEDPFFYTNGGEVYYEGRAIPENDPKDEYTIQYGSRGSSTDCVTSISRVEATEMLTPYGAGVPWLQVSEDADISQVEGEYCLMSEFTPFRDGDLIVAPGNVVFTTSNTSFGVGDETIEFTIGTDWKITLKCVQSWWCHLDSNGDCRHTEVVGHGATNGTDRAMAGSILGRASGSTIVYVYRKIDGEWVPSNLQSYYKS